MGYKITPKELERFYQDVDKLCAEIFDVGTIFYDISPSRKEEDLVIEEKTK